MAEGSTMEEPRASRALSTDGRLVTCWTEGAPSKCQCSRRRLCAA
jgi:hypothetical protein